MSSSNIAGPSCWIILHFSCRSAILWRKMLFALRVGIVHGINREKIFVIWKNDRIRKEVSLLNLKYIYKTRVFWFLAIILSSRVHQNNSLFQRAVRNDWTYNSLCTCRYDKNVSNGDSRRLVGCSNVRTSDSCSVPGKDVTHVFAETCRQKRDLAVYELDEEWPDFKLNESYIPPVSSNKSCNHTVTIK